jgi:hypothetical protein
MRGLVTTGLDASRGCLALRTSVVRLVKSRRLQGGSRIPRTVRPCLALLLFSERLLPKHLAPEPCRRLRRRRSSFTRLRTDGGGEGGGRAALLLESPSWGPAQASSGCSSWPMAHTKPTNSRAKATTIFCGLLPLFSR